jgi:hypothetical protein
MPPPLTPARRIPPVDGAAATLRPIPAVVGRILEEVARGDLRLKPRRKLARRRLALTLSALTPQRRERLLEASLRHRAEAAALALWASRCRPERLCRRVSLSGWRHLTGEAGSASPQLVTTWIGCWEVLAAAACLFHRPLELIATPPACPWRGLADRHLRARFAAEDAGGGSLVVLDDHAVRPESPELQSVVQGALRRRLPIVPAVAICTGGGQARVILRQPLEPTASAEVLSGRVTAALAWELRRRPAAWPWSDLAWSGA